MIQKIWFSLVCGYIKFGLFFYSKNISVKGIKNIPKKGAIESTVEPTGETITAGFKNFPLGNITELYFFPYENGHFKNISTKASRNNRDRLKLELIPDLRSKEIFSSNVRGVLSYKVNGIPKSEVIDLSTSKLISNE